MDDQNLKYVFETATIDNPIQCYLLTVAFASWIEMFYLWYMLDLKMSTSIIKREFNKVLARNGCCVCVGLPLQVYLIFSLLTESLRLTWMTSFSAITPFYIFISTLTFPLLKLQICKAKVDFPPGLCKFYCLEPLLYWVWWE